MTSRNGSSAPAAVTLGAVRGQLEKNGYLATSAVLPFGAWPFNSWPATDVACMHNCCLSEHPVAIACEGGPHKLLVLILQPVDDSELAERIRGVFDAAVLTAGPRREGSDGTLMWPLRFDGGRALTKTALDGVVTFTATLVPLDATWSQSLLDVKAEALPAVSTEQIDQVLKEIEALPGKLRQERAPPPRPSKRAWLGAR